LDLNTDTFRVDTTRTLAPQPTRGARSDSIIPASPVENEPRLEDWIGDQDAHRSASADAAAYSFSGTSTTQMGELQNPVDTGSSSSSDAEDQPPYARGGAGLVRLKLPKVARSKAEREAHLSIAGSDGYSVPVSPNVSDHGDNSTLKWVPAPAKQHTLFPITPPSDAENIATSTNTGRVSASQKVGGAVGEALMVTPAMLMQTLPNGHNSTNSDEDQARPESLKPLPEVLVLPADSTEPELPPNLTSLRHQLPFRLLSCIERDSLRLARYDDLLGQLRCLSQNPPIDLEDSQVAHAQLGHIALEIWTQMMHKISHFRHFTGFHGERHEWLTFSKTLQLSDRLKATLCFAEMQSFMAKLKSTCDALTAESVGQIVATELWKMAGRPNIMSRDDLAEYLCDFCEELFVWFE
jgi:hypothetical protein